MTRVDLSSLSRDELMDMIIAKDACELALKAEIEWYKARLRLSVERRFGKSSEKNIIEGQISLESLGLFNEAEVFADKEEGTTEPDISDKADNEAQKKSVSLKKKKDLSSLCVVTTEYTLSPKERVCPVCGEGLHEMKRIVRREIEVIPAKVFVHEHSTAVYSCRSCEKERDAVIINAPGSPVPVIKGSAVSPSLAADIITKKYDQALPFDRQEQQYRLSGIDITKNNMCNWSVKIAEDWLSKITERMREILYADKVIHCDETHLQVINEDAGEQRTKSYVWVTTSAKAIKKHKIALYKYTKGRSAQDARSVLCGYSGYIMCDGYSGYDALKKTGSNGEPPMNVTLCACLVHVRRKFSDALKVIPPKLRKDSLPQEAINRISALFRLDNAWDDLSAEERYHARMKYLSPKLDEFFLWVKKESAEALPKSHLGEALAYALGQKEKIKNVLLDGRLELDNNLAERTIKPFVIGRKNWLFSNTRRGADASCVCYSVVQTAKLNGLNPFKYIKYLLEKLPALNDFSPEKIDALLPWAQEIPEEIKA